MKKISVVFSVLFFISMVVISCKENKKEKVKSEVKTEVEENHNHDTDAVSDKAVYQCPMNCEEGKTYDAPGNCPKCNMALKNVSEKSETKMHAENCKCKDAGKCSCKGETCQCKKETAAVKKECKKGACKCKA